MLHCYGENSFTYLLFTELTRNQQLITPLISNLKQFVSTKTIDKTRPDILREMESDSQEPDVWLFPNFGKAHGFGEPDAILLCGGYSFWFEVETNFHLKKRRSSARTSLTQLLRFYYFGQALAGGSQKRNQGKDHLALIGPTINGKGEVKDAVLRLAKHSVLSRIGKQLRASVEHGKDHYVLFSERKMNSVSKNGKTQSAIHRLFSEVVEDVHPLITEWSKENCPRNTPNKPPVERFWYSYYEGDLKRKVSLEDPSVEYVRIATG